MKFGFVNKFVLDWGASIWNNIARHAEAQSLGDLISIRNRAAELRRILDTVIMRADHRADNPRQGSTRMKMPDDADWRWRPDAFSTRMGQINSVIKVQRHDLGS